MLKGKWLLPCSWGGTLLTTKLSEAADDDHEDDSGLPLAQAITKESMRA